VAPGQPRERILRMATKPSRPASRISAHCDSVGMFAGGDGGGGGGD